MDIKQFTFLVLLILLLSCARRGRPEGGPRDFDKPIMVKTEPEFKSLHFDSDEIKIYFDEYVKLKEVSSQLIISPPLKYPPVITPLGTPSKRLTIKLRDTLNENTTYTFNFGQSIIDNTEGNILENFKYIFSTGDYIDSLRVKGKIKDAFDLEMIENPTLMLYPVTESYHDSIVYSEKPTYVGGTLDSLNWSIDNIKEGTYRLIAMNDMSKNYKYNPKEDRIGFYEEYIQIPGDSIVDLVLFKEILPFDPVSKASDISKGHVVIGHQGTPEDLEIDILSETPGDFTSFYSQDRETDTIHFWYKNFEGEEMLLKVRDRAVMDTIKVRLSKEEIDSLEVEFSARGTLHLRDSLKIEASVPIVSLDTTKFFFIDQDSLRVPFQYSLSSDKGSVHIDFEKELQKKYVLNMYPGAIEDIFGVQNDSLQLKFKTGKIADYCSLFVNLRNVKEFPIIVDLINERGDLVARQYADQNREFEFGNLRPSRFMVRIIYDSNDNGRYDTGSFLDKRQPEEVHYVKSIIEAKANWEVVETLVLDP